MVNRNVDECTNNRAIGTCVVFNCKNFKKNGKIDEESKRDGTEHDGKKIKDTFCEFKYDVVTIDDPKEVDIETELAEIGMKIMYYFCSDILVQI